MRKQYKVVEPTNNTDFETQWMECFQKMALFKMPDWQLFRVCAFVDASTDDEWEHCYKVVANTMTEKFGDACPTFSVIAQPPRNNYKIALELGFIETVDAQLYYKKAGQVHYVLAVQGLNIELWAAGMGAVHNTHDIATSAISAFEQMKTVLDAEGMSFDNLVRQWNYIGEILAIDHSNGTHQQHYQLFNETRSHYYQKYRKTQGYPAATGIGAKAGGVIIDFCAVRHPHEKFVIAIKNPSQLAPYHYSQQLLEGEAPIGKSHKQAPQFERATLVSNHVHPTLFVSGTAAIVGEQTIGIGQVHEQTDTTLKHIAQLVSLDNLKAYSNEIAQKQPMATGIRVYVKHGTDIDKVKAICEGAFGHADILYVCADVCRDNLLVEIEAEFTL